MSQRLNELGLPIGEAMPNWTARPRPPRRPIEGRYCRLEPLSVADHTEDLFEAYSADKDGRVWTYLPEEPFDRIERFRTWMEGAAQSADPLFHTIIDAATNKAVGFASYLRIQPEVGVIEVGYISYSLRLQRTRAATETMFLMMRRAFDELGYRRYEWKCDSLNAASRAAAERLGFSYDGLFRQAQVYKGRNRDTAWFSILDGDWPALRKAYEIWLDPSNFTVEGTQRQRLADLIAAERQKGN